VNRYVVAGVLADLIAGRRVLVMTQNVLDGRDLLEQLAVAAEHKGIRSNLTVARAHGAERVGHTGGGWVLFRSLRTGCHGLTADVVFIDGDPTPEQLAGVMPVVASTGGEVFRR
jgi:hypothetical protein